MTRTIVVTGAASGIGRATSEALTAQGHRIIGVDLRETEVTADLSTPRGREAMARQIGEIAPEGVDSVVAVAGVSNAVPVTKMVAVNYFGAIATLELLRPYLLRSSAPSAVAVISTAALLQHDDELVAACRSGDEAAALARAASLDPMGPGYASTKYALARWLRETAVSADWAGSGILLNGVAPGAVMTAMTSQIFASENGPAMMRQVTPIALPGRDWGEPSELAEAIGFLATLQGRYLLGQILYVDGGTEAIMRPEAI